MVGHRCGTFHTSFVCEFAFHFVLNCALALFRVQKSFCVILANYILDQPYIVMGANGIFQRTYAILEHKRELEYIAGGSPKARYV